MPSRLTEYFPYHQRQYQLQHFHQISDNLLHQNFRHIYARTDDRDIQNSKAFYAMVSKSVTGTIHDIVFDQAQNLPTNKYGISLFKLFTSLTVFASI